MSIRKTLIGTGAAVLTAASLALATPAFAVTYVGTNQPNVVNAAQGTTTTLNWTYLNTGSNGSTAPSDPNGTITFNAPAGTTFTAQSTVPTSYSSNGTTFGSNSIVLNNCTLGAGSTTLTCNIPSAPNVTNGWAWPTGGYFRFSPTVAVDSNATPGTVSAAASMSWTGHAGTLSGTGPQVPLTITDGTLDVNIVQSADVPLVDPTIGAATLALGRGAGLWTLRHRTRRHSS